MALTPEQQAQLQEYWRTHPATPDTVPPGVSAPGTPPPAAPVQWDNAFGISPGNPPPAPPPSGLSTIPIGPAPEDQGQSTGSRITNFLKGRADEAGADSTPIVPSIAPGAAITPKGPAGGAAEGKPAQQPPLYAWGNQGGGSAVRVPAAEVPTVGPIVQGAINKSNAVAGEALEDIAARDQDQSILDQAKLLDERKQMEARQAEINDREKVRADELKSRQEKADALVDQAASVGIDSKRLWNNMGTGSKVLAILGMALGSFGKHNDALDMYNKAVDADIDEQKTNQSIMSAHGQQARGLYSDALSRFGDERQAEAAARLAYNDIAQRKLQEIAAGDKSAETQDQLARSLALLERQKAEDTSKMLKYVPSYVAGGGGGTTEKQVQAYAQMLIEKGIASDEVSARKQALAHYGGTAASGGYAGSGAPGRADEKEKTLNGQTEFVASELIKKGIPEARTKADRVLDFYSNPASAGYTGPIANDLYISSPMLFKARYGNTGVAGQQAWTDFKSDALHTLSGAAVSPTELARLNGALEGANDPRSRRQAAEMVKSALDNAETTIKAGVSPEASAEYDRRINAQKPQATSGGFNRYNTPQ